MGDCDTPQTEYDIIYQMIN